MNTYPGNPLEKKSAGGISLRYAIDEDCPIVWKWANDPLTRKASFSSQTILWEEHIKWFKLKLKDANCLFYIIMQNSTMIPVGSIRYDILEGNAVVSINMAPDQRRRHMGSQAVMLSGEMMIQNPAIEVIHAFIRADNIPSIKTFAKSGYINAGMVAINNELAYDYIKKRSIK